MVPLHDGLGVGLDELVMTLLHSETVYDRRIHT